MGIYLVPVEVSTGQIKVDSVSNILALRNYSGSANTVIVAGYAAAGDGGGGTFNFSTGAYTDDYGTVIVPASRSGGAWLRQVGSGYWNVNWFGCFASKGTYYTVQAQNAHNTGQVIFYPGGTYYITGLSIAAGGIVGASTYQDPAGQTGATVIQGLGSGIVWTGTSSSANSPVFMNFFMQGGGVSTGLQIGPPDGSGKVVASAFIQNVNCNGFTIGIFMRNTVSFTVTGCQLSGCTIACIKVSCNNYPDAGDSAISLCQFNGSLETNCIGVLQANSGGLKISTCKFLSGAYGYQFNYPAGYPGTSDLMISNCSFENMGTAAIDFKNTVSTAGGNLGFNNICITGNEFGENPRDLYFESTANQTNVFSWWYNISITGNTFFDCSNINIEMASCFNFLIEANTFNGFGGATAYAIVIDSTCTLTGTVGINDYQAYGKAYVVNSGTGVTVLYIPNQTVATLPAASTIRAGCRTFITDSTTLLGASPATLGAAVSGLSGNGTNYIPVFTNSTPAWVVG